MKEFIQLMTESTPIFRREGEIGFCAAYWDEEINREVFKHDTRLIAIVNIFNNCRPTHALLYPATTGAVSFSLLGMTHVRDIPVTRSCAVFVNADNTPALSMAREAFLYG